MYQRVGGAAYKIDLSNTLKLCEYLGNPENKFKSVHIAGTNGKGSTSHMLASVLQVAGYRVGLYTSPHLKDFRERIKINGRPISKAKVTSFVKNHKPFFEANQLSFFEMTVGMAFDHFANEKVDIAVVEVGLGGRLDSTNVVIPEVAVITNIGFDHMQFLGDTYAKIAAEKAGIIKPRIPVVIGETNAETKAVFERIANKNKAPVVWAENDELPGIQLDLKGNYQQLNARTALAALEELKNKGFKISERQSKDGFKKVVANTGLLGRWQILGQRPQIIADTAHNKEGLQLVLEQLRQTPYKELHFVLGFVNDKALDGLVEMFPEDATYYFCAAKIPRALAAEELQAKFSVHGRKGKVYSSVGHALGAAKRRATKDDLIYLGGSTFTVAEVV